MEKLWRKLLSSRYLFLFFLVLLSTDAATASHHSTANSTFNWGPVMAAIIQVESGGNPKAISGNSVGAMQITPILVAECNNILKLRNSKKRFKLSDRLSVRKSKEMFLLIQSRYNPLNNIEHAIRSWNGGMHYSKRRTQHYFNKVMRFMK